MGAKRRPTPAPSNVAVLPVRSSDAQLLELVRRGDPAAPAMVFDRFSKDINRVIWRCLGADAEHDDIVHDAFIAVLKGLARVNDPHTMRNWVVSVAVNTARTELRKRRFRRTFWSPDPLPDVPVDIADAEARDLLRHVYAILDRFPADERIAFVLRHVERCELAEAAALAGCSLATIKRRLARAAKRFARLAGNEPSIAQRLAYSKWGGNL